MNKGEEFGYEWTHTDGTKRAILCVYSEKAGLWAAIVSDGKGWCLAEDNSYSKSWGAIATLVNIYKDNLWSHGLNPQPCKVEDYEVSYHSKRKERTMSNRAFAGAKAYVDNFGINALSGEVAILFEKYVYGFVADDFDELEIADGPTEDNPLANVLRAKEIADEVNAKRITLRQWYAMHAGDEDFSYHMKEDF